MSSIPLSTDKQDSVYTGDINKLGIVSAHRAAIEFEYGSIINKEWLMEAFEIDTPEYGTQQTFIDASFEFMQNMDLFRECLLEKYQMCLINVRGYGYQVISPKHQSDYAMTRLRKTLSHEINRAVRTLTHINEQLLSQDDIKRRDEQQGKIAALAAFSKAKRIR
jgi:hypothetical protein